MKIRMFRFGSIFLRVLVFPSVLSFSLISAFLYPAFANTSRVVKNSEESIPVRVKIGSVTEVEFQERVANVAKGLPADILQVETLENRIFLLPLQEFEGDIFIVTQDNISYALHLSINEAADARIKVLKPAEHIVQPESDRTADTVAVVKSLMLGLQPVGSVSLPVYNYEIFNNGSIRIVVKEVFELPGGVRALRADVENLIDRPVVFPIQNIQLPGLLAISVDSQILEARQIGKEQRGPYITKAYMIITS